MGAIQPRRDTVAIMIIMIEIKTKKLFLTGLIIMLLLLSCKRNKIQISLNLKKGQTYNQIITTEEYSTRIVNGQTLNLMTSTSRSMAYLVKKVAKNSFDIDAKYKKLSIAMKFPSDTMNFSSEYGNDPNSFSHVLYEVKDKPFFVQIGKDGEVYEVKDIDLIFTDLFAKLSYPQKNNVRHIEEEIFKEFGSSAIKNNLGRLVSILPDQSVKVGDTWGITSRSDAGGGTTMKFTYQYRGMTDSVYLIHVDGVIKSENTSFIKTDGLLEKYNLLGSINSDIQINKLTGWLFKAQIIENVKGYIETKDDSVSSERKPIAVRFRNVMSISDR